MNLHEHLDQIRELDDDALLHSLKRFVASSNHLTALVLAHLAEVDARGAYRKWACDTLMTYCVYELRLSEDEAQRRCRAARVARQFPVLFAMLADASIHLTGILLLAPYLTVENHRELLARARYRRKREIERLVAELAPSIDVPSLVEPLGPCRDRGPVRAGAKWGALAEAMMGGVRRLVPGDGPAEAPSATEEWRESLMESVQASAPALIASPEHEPSAPARNGNDARPATVDSALARNDAGAPGTQPPSPPLRYKVQFTADQAYVDLLERARDLLWHQLPTGDLAELQRMALDALMEKLLRRKGVTSASAAPARSPTVERESSAPARSSTVEHESSAPARSPTVEHESSAPARSASVDAEPAAPARRSAVTDPYVATPSSRHLPAALRRSVWQRDGGQCAFIDERGVRCRATAAIEFHHHEPHARGGANAVENVSLRCRAHNALAAEQDFGRAFMERKQQGARHDSSSDCRA